jgi:hypothetical protein
MTASNAPKEPKAPRPAKKKVTDLTAENLVSQDDGSKRPLSVQTDNLQASVEGDLGRVLVKISNKGYIAAEPVVLLGKDVEELRKIVDELDALAHSRLTEK